LGRYTHKGEEHRDVDHAWLIWIGRIVAGLPAAQKLRAADAQAALGASVEHR